MGTYIFYIYARNSYNVQTFSDKIVVNVITDCAADVISLKSSSVSQALADTINPSVGRFWTIHKKPRLVFKTYTYKF